MWKIAFRNLLSKKTRTFLALTGLVIAVVGVIGLISISDGIKGTITETLGKVQGVQVLQKDVFSPAFSSVKLSVIPKIESLPEVNVVVPRVFRVAFSVEGTRTFSGGSEPPFIVGIDPVKEQATTGGGSYGTRVTKGRFLKTSDKYAVIIGKKIADDFKKPVGSMIEINNYNFRVVGILETSSSSMDTMMLMPISTVRSMFGLSQDEASMLYVDLKNPADAESVAKKIELRVDGVDAKTGTEFATDITSVLGSLDMFFWAISLIAVLVGGVGILNTMLMSVMERFRDFGILKAIGWSNSNVMTLVISESVILGAAGGIAGVILGTALVEVAKPILGFPMQVSLSLAVTAFLLSVFLGLIGGLYPARKASKLNPIEAIRYG
jgi:putative ABC transport system permease protein